MDHINKLLILLLAFSIAGSIYSNSSTNNSFSKTVTNMNDNITHAVENMADNFTRATENMIHNKNVEMAPHPYNVCIKLLIDQVNHENSKSDFNEMKSVCYELMRDKLENDKKNDPKE